MEAMNNSLNMVTVNANSAKINIYQGGKLIDQQICDVEYEFSESSQDESDEEMESNASKEESGE